MNLKVDQLFIIKHIYLNQDAYNNIAFVLKKKKNV